jgi:hypothetical protein
MRRGVSIRALASCVALIAAACGSGEPGLLSAPPKAQGFQLTIPAFPVPSGTETQRCYFFAVPGAPGQEIWVNRYDVSQAIGSHHMNLFRVKTIRNLSGKPGDVVIDGECFISSNWSDWPLVVNSQQAANVSWALPDGVGAKFTAGELLMLQTHFVNATTQKTPGVAHVEVNLWTLPQPAPHELGTAFATNQNIQVCPGDVDRTYAKSCQFPGNSPIHVVAANGHFHSRGTLFEMFAVDAAGNEGTRFYTSTQWDDPPMTRSDATHPSIAEIGAGGRFEWKCHFDFPTTPGACGADKSGKPTPNCCYLFGPHVDTNEHCNAFVYYWPKASTDVSCF